MVSVLLQVAELSRAGDSAKQIATQLGLSERQIYRYRKICGAGRTNKPRLSQQEIAHAERLFAEGCSRREVARTLGRSPSTIAKALPHLKWSISQSNEFRAMMRHSG